MTGGTLVISRMIKLHDRIKRRFEELGFTNVTVTGEEKDSLNCVINERKPRLVIIGSGFYRAATPYMTGRLLKDFPKLHIAAVSVSEYPDDVAAWFKWYGVKSYANLLEGYEEFHRGLQEIRQGREYVAPAVQRVLNESAEWKTPKANVPKRRREVLMLLCNGFSINEIGDCLHISRRTVDGHLEELYSSFCVHSREGLIRNAFCLGAVTKDDLCFYPRNK
ncbi:MAG: LuxR C-terminal-related transcriptional regulator [Treponema sp.]|nr:LuxR C-terminal-related transcriptional regulator [Treponema sp.]